MSITQQEHRSSWEEPWGNCQLQIPSPSFDFGFWIWFFLH